jgi:hypothetical protein
MKPFYRSHLKYWLALCVVASSLWGQDVDATFVLETSPGTEQAIGLIRPRDLQESDRAGVIGFLQSPQVFQPLTANREAFAAALRHAGTRIAVGFGVTRPDTFRLTVDLSGAIKQACREFEPDNSARRKRAVIVFFANEDPNLGTRLDSLKNALRTAEARLFGVVIQRVPGPDSPCPRGLSGYPFPVMTAQFLSQLARDSGGRIFRRNWELRKILAETRKRTSGRP